MSLPITSTGVAITNPLVLYRALVATNRIAPDPSQHRLAIHLQKLYDRLKDYEPTVEYKHRLNQISKAVGPSDREDETSTVTSLGQRGIWQSLIAQKEKRDSLALTRTLTNHEAAASLDSPKGLMLHGEVGTGKSMLIDLFADCLPNRKKARWHFNTFILETFAKLEQLRRDRLIRIPPSINSPDVDDYSLLWLARDMINTSPILFLDEFQLPDRAASKIMTNLMTSFFQLGGVLIATSNRMPEELHKAAGMSFAPPTSRIDSFAYRLGLSGSRRTSGGGRSDNMFSGEGEFAGFLDVLKARCEVWEMNGGKDYRRQEIDFQAPSPESQIKEDEQPWQMDEHQDLQRLNHAVGAAALTSETTAAAVQQPPPVPPQAPKNYLIRPVPTASKEDLSAYEQALHNLTPLIPTLWAPSTLLVYGRTITLPNTSSSPNGVLKSTFASLCGTATFGPADYISLASTYHTLILIDVPVLSLLQKNEARRFITLLDALYEARCKLLVLNAAAGPDNLFFPPEANKPSNAGEEHEGGVYAETFSEAYQDVTAPFRPNISSQTPDFAEERDPVDYTHSRFEGMLAPDALEDDPPNRARRMSQSESERGPIDPDDDVLLRHHTMKSSISSVGASGGGRGGVDFGKTQAFTGEDEKFAFKRAQSRIWEMCSARWWARTEADWHRPVPASVRRWERPAAHDAGAVSGTASSVYIADRGVIRTGAAAEAVFGSKEGSVAAAPRGVDDGRDEILFRHGASPFRTSREPPPKFSWTHIWGTMKWGKKAGAWGQGVEGLEERKREKMAEEEKQREGKEGRK